MLYTAFLWQSERVLHIFVRVTAESGGGAAERGRIKKEADEFIHQRPQHPQRQHIPFTVTLLGA